MIEGSAVPGLAELLEHLEEKAEEGMARTTVSGRALSRSADSPQMATTSGIVAIPLSEISEVRPRGDDPRRVAVSVRSGDRVRHLQRVRPVIDNPLRRGSIDFRGRSLPAAHPLRVSTRSGHSGGGNA